MRSISGGGAEGALVAGEVGVEQEGGVGEVREDGVERGAELVAHVADQQSRGAAARVRLREAKLQRAGHLGRAVRAVAAAVGGLLELHGAHGGDGVGDVAVAPEQERRVYGLDDDIEQHPHDSMLFISTRVRMSEAVTTFLIAVAIILLIEHRSHKKDAHDKRRSRYLRRPVQTALPKPVRSTIQSERSALLVDVQSYTRCEFSSVPKLLKVTSIVDVVKKPSEANQTAYRRDPACPEIFADIG